MATVGEAIASSVLAEDAIAAAAVVGMPVPAAAEPCTGV
jgi:hypothetical protein